MVVNSGLAVKFELLRRSDSPEMDRVLDLYAAAIPPHERKTEAAIRRLTGSDRHRIEVALAEEVLVGFAVAYIGPEVGLLEYMAVEEAWRGREVGQALFRRAAAATGGAPLLVEVESDRSPTADLENRRRRLSFYRRLGCQRVEGLDYVLPLGAAAEGEAIDLMVAGLDSQGITREALRRWLQAVYVEVYDCEASDRRIERMLACCADRLRLV